MLDEPTENEAKVYMEICASLMTKFGMTEVDIDLSHVPNKPFAIWRRVNGDKLEIKLVWDMPAVNHS
jgi:hypothetical protein